MQLETIAKYPSGAALPTPLLFVHGAMHGAWYWDVHFLDYFAQLGYAAYAVNLRGHGKSEGRDKLRWTRLSDYVEDLAIAAQQLPSPPILIGHSMGGIVIQKYLEQHRAPGAVLLSSPSPAGLLLTALKIAQRRPIVFAKISLTLSMLPLIATPQLAREAFFSADVPDAELLAYWDQMQDESFMGFLGMVALELPHPAKVTTPVLVLGAGRDKMLKPAEIDATARAYHTQSEIIADVAHNSMLETRWEAVAERILKWLDAMSSSPFDEQKRKDSMR